jgi:hypothetical protein
MARRGTAGMVSFSCFFREILAARYKTKDSVDGIIVCFQKLRDRDV